MSEEKTSYNFESEDLIVYLWKKRTPLIIITLAAAVLSTIVSFTITPKFRSSVVLFPASESPVSKSLLQVNYQDRIGILGFGAEEQLERILQVLHSDDIRDQIIEKYDLMAHYEIDPEGAFPLTKLYAEYASNIKFRRTEYNSVVIEVMDKDPQMAADIANDLAMMIDATMNRMKKDRAIRAFELVEQEYLAAQERVRELNDSIALLNKMGVISSEHQIERLTESYGQALIAGNQLAVERITESIGKLEDHSSDFVLYRSMLETEVLRMRDLKTKFVEAKAETELTLSHVFILDKAFKAEKKAYPKKSIIVLVSTIAAFLLAVIALLFFENFLRKIREAA